MKRYVSATNREFKIEHLSQDGLLQVSADNWEKCVKHTTEVETHYREKDHMVKEALAVEEMIIYPNRGKSESNKSGATDSDSTLEADSDYLLTTGSSVISI